MLLTNEISVERKIKEILLATRIEAAMPKDRILELYLNEIYLGAGAYGVASAALDLFRQIARRIDPRRGGVSRRAAQGAQPLQPDALSAGGQGAARLGA